MEENAKLAKTIAINSRGEIIVEQADSDSSDSEQEEARYLSYITADDFESLDSKYFKLGEIANLLASSDLRQRVFALNMLLRVVSHDLTERDANLLFGIILNPDHLQPCSIVHRVEQLIRTSASRTDFFPLLACFLNNTLKQVFQDVQKLRQRSLIKQFDQKGLRLFQCYLSDMVQGGTVFDPSFLVPRSRIAHSFLEAIFAKDDLNDLLRQSVKKMITIAIDTQSPEKLPEVLGLTLFMACFSKSTEAAASQIFIDYYKQLV